MLVVIRLARLRFRACFDESFARFGNGVLREVLDESAGEVLSFIFPDRSVGVGVARIEDSGIDSGKSGRDFEIEVRDLLGGSFVDRARKDSVDNSAGILDRDTLAGSVPAGVDEVSLRARSVHLFDEFFRVLGGREFEERLTEASREGGGGLGYSALGARKFSGEAGQEVVLSLLGGKDRNGRKYSERVRRKEDDVLRRGSGRNGANDVFDVVDRVGNAGVLGDAFVRKVDLAVFVEGYVLQKRVATYSVVNIGFGILIEVDNLRVAAALEVEHAVVVPAVLVVADKKAFGVGGKGGFACSGKSEEDSGVFAVHIGVGRAMHRSDALKRQVVVHHREHTFLHFAAVPGVYDNLFARSNVEHNRGLAVKSELFVILDLSFGSVVNHEVGLERSEFFLGGANKHISYEMRLPSDLDDKADSHTSVLVRAAERVHDEKALVAEFLDRDVFYRLPGLFGSGVVVVLVAFARPPYGVARIVVHNDVLVFGRASGVYAGHNVHRAELAYLTLFVADKVRVRFLDEELFVGRIVHDFGRAGDTVLG